MFSTGVLKAVIKALVLPPTGFILVALAGLALALRNPRIGYRIALAGLLGLLVVAMPLTAGLLVSALPSYPPFDPAQAQNAGAIVVLGGGIRRNAPEYSGDTLSSLTLERVRYGARVARLTGLPILVSGGRLQPATTPEAVLMQRALTEEFHVPVRWVEAHATNTRENAVLSARLLHSMGIGKVVLVMHAFDMPRAAAEFERQGIAIVAAPTRLARNGDFDLLDLVPSIGGLQTSYYAIYEILGNVLLHLR